MAGFWEQTDQLRPGMVVVAGVPHDEHSSFMHGCAFAPRRVRERLYSDEANLCAENGVDLGREPRFLDLGDLPLVEESSGIQQIEEAAAVMLRHGVHLLALGGDHAITYPLIKAHAGRYPQLTVLHLDAHPDLYDSYQGDPFSHACPFARIMESGLVARLVQVGIRTMNAHQRAQAERFGVEVIEMRDWRPNPELSLSGPIYVSLDMDALDPAFAPGVSHHEPGGLSTREVLGLIQALPGPIVGADIVEFNPARDPQGITAMAAAKLLKEIAGAMLTSNPAAPSLRPR